MGLILTQTASYNEESHSPNINVPKLIDLPEVGCIHHETEWRRPRVLNDIAARDWKGVVSKWTDANPNPRLEHIDPLFEYYTIGLAVRRTNAMFMVSGNMVHNGEILPGMSHVSGPEDTVQASFRAPCDFIHLFIAKSFITQCFEECDISETPGPPQFRTRFAKDAIIEQLIRSLSFPKPCGLAMGQLYIEGVCLAIIARLISEKYDGGQSLDKPKISALANWRLKRALEYIETKISEPITLADVAASTGLTRMYFAAQFRAATGLRPHEYILRRRIERAQSMLLTSNITLIDAAFSVGFQTQAHFTTVFKKVVGETPYRWRETNLQRCGTPKLFLSPQNDVTGKQASTFKENTGRQNLPRARSNGFEYASG
jgi:AraC-like DNA-binding protein